MNKLEVPWIVKDNSIITAETRRVMTAGGKFIFIHDYIAFNIGDTAEHIVKLHNDSLHLRERK